MTGLLLGWLRLECRNVGLNGLIYSGLGVEMGVHGSICVRNATWRSGLWICGPTMLLIVQGGGGSGTVALVGDGLWDNWWMAGPFT